MLPSFEVLPNTERWAFGAYFIGILVVEPIIRCILSTVYQGLSRIQDSMRNPAVKVVTASQAVRLFTLRRVAGGHVCLLKPCKIDGPLESIYM